MNKFEKTTSQLESYILLAHIKINAGSLPDRIVQCMMGEKHMTAEQAVSELLRIGLIHYAFSNSQPSRN